MIAVWGLATTGDLPEDLAPPVTGYLVLLRFEHVHPRAEAALNAMPAAVLTALVARAAMQGSWIEWSEPVVAGPVALRGGMVGTFPAGAATPIVLRQFLPKRRD